MATEIMRVRVYDKTRHEWREVDMGIETDNHKIIDAFASKAFNNPGGTATAVFGGVKVFRID